MASGCWRWRLKDLPGKDVCSLADERDLVLRGYVAFLDPPKKTAGLRSKPCTGME